MNRKEGRHKNTPPEGSRHRSQDKEEKNNRDGMQQDINKMIATRVQTEELCVQHEGEGSQRMPVPDQRTCERPDESSVCQTITD